MATIKDIAAKLGISISTVSKGLHGASDISEEMRQQVLDTAIMLGYVIKDKKTIEHHKVCIMIENMDYENINQFGYELITGFRLRAQDSQFQVDIVPMDVYTQTKQTYDTFMLQNNYSGAFFLGFEMNDVYLAQLEHTKIPTVLFDNYVPNEKVAYIGTDDQIGIQSLVAHLHQHGHRKIALINGSKNSYISMQRQDAFISSLNRFSITVEPDLIVYATSFHPESVAQYIPQLVEQGATAIICGSDLIASVTMNELRKLGLHVPNDISVTGYDDLPVSKYFVPPLTTIHQERFELGKNAFSMLNKMIKGQTISTMLYHSKLIIRESVADRKIN